MPDSASRSSLRSAPSSTDHVGAEGHQILRSSKAGCAGTQRVVHLACSLSIDVDRVELDGVAHDTSGGG